MIELTWGQIRDTNFFTSARKLFKSPLDFSVGLNVLTIIKAIDKEKELANPMWEKHVNEFYKKEGAAVELREGSDDFKKKEYDSYLKLSSHKFSINAPKIKVEDLSKVVLTPEEIMTLSSLIEINNGPVNEPSKAKTDKTNDHC